MFIGISIAVNNAFRYIFGTSFSPLELFTGGYTGGWYDPSDLSTMFTTSTGATQVTADGDLVGLMLDKSQGLALGAEHISVAADRDFSSDTGYWTKGVGATITGGVVDVSTASDIYPIYKFNQFPSGGYYEITYTLTVASGGCGYWINGRNGAVKTVSGTYTDRIFTVPLATLGFRTGGAFVGTIDNVSVKPILGNHLTQATSGARPQYKTSGGLHWLEFDGIDDLLANSTYANPSVLTMIDCRADDTTTAASRTSLGTWESNSGFNLRQEPSGAISVLSGTGATFQTTTIAK